MYYKREGAVSTELERLFDLLEESERESPETTVTSLRLPRALRDAVRLAVGLGLERTVNEASVRSIHDHVAVFAQRRALEEHYAAHPEVRPDLVELAQAAAELDEHPLAEHPDLLQRAATEVLQDRSAPTPDDVLLYATALRRAFAA